jgi:hypothetical protein
MKTALKSTQMKIRVKNCTGKMQEKVNVELSLIVLCRFPVICLFVNPSPNTPPPQNHCASSDVQIKYTKGFSSKSNKRK